MTVDSVRDLVIMCHLSGNANKVGEEQDFCFFFFFQIGEEFSRQDQRQVED